MCAHARYGCTRTFAFVGTCVHAYMCVYMGICICVYLCIYLREMWRKSPGSMHIGRSI